MNSNKTIFPCIYLLHIAEVNYLYCHSGFRIQDSGFRIQDSGFRIQDSGFRIPDSGFQFRIPDSGFHGRLPLDQKFRNFGNGDKRYGNFLGKVPENRGNDEFPKSEQFNRKFLKSRDENQMEQQFPGKRVENLGIPHEVVLFFGINANSQLSPQR